MRYCAMCGSPLANDDHFCQVCGEAAPEEPTPVSPPATEEPAQQTPPPPMPEPPAQEPAQVQAPLEPLLGDAQPPAAPEPPVLADDAADPVPTEPRQAAAAEPPHTMAGQNAVYGNQPHFQEMAPGVYPSSPNAGSELPLKIFSGICGLILICRALANISTGIDLVSSVFTYRFGAVWLVAGPIQIINGLSYFLMAIFLVLFVLRTAHKETDVLFTGLCAGTVLAAVSIVIRNIWAMLLSLAWDYMWENTFIPAILGCVVVAAGVYALLCAGGEKVLSGQGLQGAVGELKFLPQIAADAWQDFCERVEQYNDIKRAQRQEQSKMRNEAYQQAQQTRQYTVPQGQNQQAGPAPYATPQGQNQQAGPAPYGTPQGQNRQYDAPPVQNASYQNVPPQQQYQPPMPLNYSLKTNRSLLTYFLLTVVTCGIYSLFFIHDLVKEVNTACAGDGQETPSLLKLILFSLLTCGFYSYYWYYKLGNRLQQNAPRYGMTFSENGTTILLWDLVGLLICGLGPLVGMHIIIKNTNAICAGYNATLR